jgi:hypothetical protein
MTLSRMRKALSMRLTPIFQTLLEQYALLSLEKQDKLDLLLDEHAHELDLDTGTIRFNAGIEFPFQVLGTESDNTLTWLWSWAEEQTEVPDNLISSALGLRDWGEREHISEFTLPSLDIDRADGLAISLVASQISQANCFYQDRYEGGSLFLLLFDRRIDEQPAFDRTRLFHHFFYLIQRYELNHRNLLLSYLRTKDLSPVVQGAFITCELATGERVLAEFDDQGSIVSEDVRGAI